MGMYEVHPGATSITLACELASQYAAAVQSWHRAVSLLWLEVSIPLAAGSTDYESMLEALRQARELAVGLGAVDLVAEIDGKAATIVEQREQARD